MDVSKIDFRCIETFNLSHEMAKNVFKADPIAASARKQKKIRKWVEKNYIEDEMFPTSCPEVMQYIDKEVSDKDFFEFIKACHEYVQINDTNKKRLFDKFSADFSDGVKSAIWKLLKDGIFYSNFRRVGTDAQIDLEFGSGYDRTLTLINASGIPEGSFDCLHFLCEPFVRQDDKYILSGEAENFGEELTTPFSIRFTDAKVEITLSRADEQTLMGTPWAWLESIAADILDKHIFLPDKYFNDKEKEILPLIAEISKLSYWAMIPDEFKSAEFPQLKAYIAKFGYNELLPLVENLEKEYFNENKKYRVVEKLVSKLDNQKYEPLWREMYNILVKTQEEYPSRVDLFCPTDLLNETRSNIQKLMEAHGYSGQYPDFVKKGEIRGVRLTESYDKSYLIGAEKNVVYHIHCSEEYFSEHLMVEFLCGTELLKKDEVAGDIYSCLFNAKGRRLFKTMSYESDYINDGELETQDLEQRVQIAVKKAELIKLTKEERKEFGDFDSPFWLLLLISIAIGGVISIISTIGFMLIGVILCLIIAHPQFIPDMFTEIPWWKNFLLEWAILDIAIVFMAMFIKRR